MKIKINNETYTLKRIGEDTTKKHNGKLEFMVYDKNGNFETNISIYGNWHHSCKEKGYIANNKKIYTNKNEAIKASLIKKTDYNPRTDMEFYI